MTHDRRPVVDCLVIISSREGKVGRREPRRYLVLLELLLVAGAVVVPSGPAHAATFVVTNTNDAGPGSLRMAISRANNNSGSDTITFASGVNGRITLTSGQLRITDNLTINGPGAGVIAVSGNNSSRVFEVAAGPTVSISGLTITEGFLSPQIEEGGAGVRNFGSLSISDSVITANRTTALDNSSGGGIQNNGSLTVTSSLISGNSADRFGGGIANLGFVNQASTRVINSRIINNSAGESGGGINNSAGGGAVLIQKSVVSDNRAEDFGGISAAGPITITGSTINRNSGQFAGAIRIAGGATISNTRILRNEGDFAVEYSGLGPSDSLAISNSVIGENTGGGLHIFSGSVVLRNNTRVVNNSASGVRTEAGGDTPVTLTVRSSAISGNQERDSGGGIHNGEGNTVNLISSTIADNTAVTGGGVYNQGTLRLQSSAITRNTATGGPGSGGGVFNDGGTVIIDANSTVSNNVPDDCVGC
jgi:Right handed beta helix region